MFHFTTTTGVAPEQIEVTYEFDDDVNLVYDQQFKWNGRECSGLLSEEVNADIDMECYANHRKYEAAEIVERNLDIGESMAADRAWARDRAMGEFA